MLKTNIRLALVNAVMSNVIRRITGSVSDFFPIKPEDDGKYSMETVMSAADQQYEMELEEMLENSLDDTDKKAVLQEVLRDLLPVINLFNKD
tara:strand:+ start:1024 stop:1299 length:276 start_codon:yes stop_codon:yes gene_type:complete